MSTAQFFPEEGRAYYRALAEEAERELLARKLEDLETRVGRREAGIRYAKMSGLPKALADVAGVMMLSADRNRRIRAAEIVGRALTRAALEAA